ncbi:TetR/AcrR family transcriptional regulator [Micropruina sp.]|uniref:TetR/AcrR family transcriptional regulator n=1 Tax=Micropruina sp. TaxID=2737536 RepID=UPI0039E5E7C8
MARRPRGQLRQDILDTVIELLIDTGDVASVSIDAVVDRVGCTPPALYYYFPTKNELLWQACDAEFAKLAEHIDADVAGIVPTGPIVELAQRGSALLHWAVAHPALYHILFMGTRQDGLVRGGTRDNPALRATIANLQCGIAGGLVRPEINLQLTTLALWASMHGFASLTVTFPSIPVAEVELCMQAACTPLLRSLMTPLGLEEFERLSLAAHGETPPIPVVDAP